MANWPAVPAVARNQALSAVTHGFIRCYGDAQKERTWKVSSGEVKVGGMPPDTLDWH